MKKRIVTSIFISLVLLLGSFSPAFAALQSVPVAQSPFTNGIDTKQIFLPEARHIHILLKFQNELKFFKH